MRVAHTVLINYHQATTLVVSQTGKIVNDVIGITRTAVMFIQNNKAISI